MRRDWTAAVAAHEGRPCRVCLRWPRELAHVLPRKFDVQPGRRPRVVRVHALAVVPLCGEHHRAYDAREFDLLPYLKPGEIDHAIRRVGEGEALRRIRGGQTADSRTGTTWCLSTPTVYSESGTK